MINIWKDDIDSREFWDFLLCLYSAIVFILIYKFQEWTPTNIFTIKVSIALALIFCLLIGNWVLVKYAFLSLRNPFDIGSGYFLLIIWVFYISVIIAVIAHDSNILIGGFSLILVIVTSYYAKLTNKFNENQLRIQKEPIIVIYAKENETDLHIIDLIIENVGNGIARNVVFKISPHGFITLSGDPLEKLYFFQTGIQALPPRQKYVIHITHLGFKIQEIKDKFALKDPKDWREKLKKELELNFEILYEDIDTRQKKNEYKINLCMFWGLRYPQNQIQTNPPVRGTVL